MEEVIRDLMLSVYSLPEGNESNQISYWCGYFRHKREEENELLRRIEYLVYTEYEVEANLTTWIEQIDHYAYIKGVDWFRGFYKLLNELELYEKGFQALPLTDVQFIPEQISPSRKLLESVTSVGGIKISVGMLLELSDKIGGDYKQTKYFDASIRNPSWELFYRSAKDFEFVEVFHESENGGRATYGKVMRLFSRFQSKVVSIEERDGEYFIYTDIFQVNLEKGLDANEFRVLETASAGRWFKSFTEKMNEKFENYQLGLIGLDQLSQTQFLNENLHLLGKHWVNYNHYRRASLPRGWKPTEKLECS